MRILFVLGLVMFSPFCLGFSICYKAIESGNPDSIIPSCFRADGTENGMTLKEAILHERVEHDMGALDAPSKERKLLESLITSDNGHLMLIYAQAYELAYKQSKIKWAGKEDGIISSKDIEDGLYDGYEEYIDKVNKNLSYWYLKAAETGDRKAMIFYIQARMNRYLPVPRNELENCLKFAKKLRSLGEPGSVEVIEAIESMLKVSE